MTLTIEGLENGRLKVDGVERLHQGENWPAALLLFIHGGSGRFGNSVSLPLDQAEQLARFIVGEVKRLRGASAKVGVS